MPKFLLPILILLILLSSLVLSAQNSKPAPLTPEQKNNLYQSAARTTLTLGKLTTLPLWAERQKALEDQDKANKLVDSLTKKLLETPEGKDYLKAANDQQEIVKSALKGVDQSKWKLNPPEGKPSDYDFVPVEAPKSPASIPAPPSPDKK